MDRKNLMPHKTQPAKPSAMAAELSEGQKSVGALELSEEALEGISGGGYNTAANKSGRVFRRL